jgi:hypothetical protein
MPSRTWHLTRGGELLAVLRPVGNWRHADYPCVEAVHETTPAFEPLRPLLERELELLEIDDEPENSEWAEIWETLKAPGMFVETPGGREHVDILWIHFQDDRAWWWPLYNSPETRLRPLPRARKAEGNRG